MDFVILSRIKKFKKSRNLRELDCFSILLWIMQNKSYLAPLKSQRVAYTAI